MLVKGQFNALEQRKKYFPAAVNPLCVVSLFSQQPGKGRQNLAGDSNQERSYRNEFTWKVNYG